MKENLTRDEAVKLCVSYQHLVFQKFTAPKSHIIYTVNFIIPVPANKYEMDEFADLVAEYLQTNDRTKLFAFDERPRKNDFIPVLFGRADLAGGANLLRAPLRSFVDQEGQMQHGFEVYPSRWLF